MFVASDYDRFFRGVQTAVAGGRGVPHREIAALSISGSIDVRNPRAVVIDLEVYLI